MAAATVETVMVTARGVAGAAKGVVTMLMAALVVMDKVRLVQPGGGWGGKGGGYDAYGGASFAVMKKTP